MAAILLDLGNTLLNEDTNRPLPGAIELLAALGDLRDPDDRPVPFGLVSDWATADDPAQVTPLLEAYLAELHASGLAGLDRKSTRLNSSHANISYAVFCLKKKKLTIVV